jgi:hypothetical protein
MAITIASAAYLYRCSLLIGAIDRVFVAGHHASDYDDSNRRAIG